MNTVKKYRTIAAALIVSSIVGTGSAFAATFYTNNVIDASALEDGPVSGKLDLSFMYSLGVKNGYDINITSAEVSLQSYSAYGSSRSEYSGYTSREWSRNVYTTETRDVKCNPLDFLKLCEEEYQAYSHTNYYSESRETRVYGDRRAEFLVAEMGGGTTLENSTAESGSITYSSATYGTNHVTHSSTTDYDYSGEVRNNIFLSASELGLLAENRGLDWSATASTAWYALNNAPAWDSAKLHINVFYDKVPIAVVPVEPAPSAVPLPASLPMLGIALAGFAGVARKRCMADVKV